MPSLSQYSRVDAGSVPTPASRCWGGKNDGVPSGCKSLRVSLNPLIRALRGFGRQTVYADLHAAHAMADPTATNTAQVILRGSHYRIGDDKARHAEGA